MHYVFDKQTKEYQYSYPFPPGCGPGPELSVTLKAPEFYRMEQERLKAYFRDGAWHYEATENS